MDVNLVSSTECVNAQLKPLSLNRLNLTASWLCRSTEQPLQAGLQGKRQRSGRPRRPSGAVRGGTRPQLGRGTWAQRLRQRRGLGRRP